MCPQGLTRVLKLLSGERSIIAFSKVQTDILSRVSEAIKSQTLQVSKNSFCRMTNLEDKYLSCVIFIAFIYISMKSIPFLVPIEKQGFNSLLYMKI